MNENETILSVPKIITVNNTGSEDITFAWRITGIKEIVKPENSVKFTVTTSEELAFYEAEFKDLGIIYEEGEGPEPEPPVPENMKRVHITNNRIVIDAPSLMEVIIANLRNTPYWKHDMAVVYDHENIRPFISLGKTSNGVEFGLINLDTFYVKLWVADEGVVNAPDVVDGASISANLGECLGYISEPESNYTIETDTLGKYVDYYTDHFELRYIDVLSGVSSEVKQSISATMPENYIN